MTSSVEASLGKRLSKKEIRELEKTFKQGNYKIKDLATKYGVTTRSIYRQQAAWKRRQGESKKLKKVTKKKPKTEGEELAEAAEIITADILAKEIIDTTMQMRRNAYEAEHSDMDTEKKQRISKMRADVIEAFSRTLIMGGGGPQGPTENNRTVSVKLERVMERWEMTVGQKKKPPKTEKEIIDEAEEIHDAIIKR